jgi:hypothetical protein
VRSSLTTSRMFSGRSMYLSMKVQSLSNRNTLLGFVRLIPTLKEMESIGVDLGGF